MPGNPPPPNDNTRFGIDDFSFTQADTPPSGWSRLPNRGGNPSWGVPTGHFDNQGRQVESCNGDGYYTWLPNHSSGASRRTLNRHWVEATGDPSDVPFPDELNTGLPRGSGRAGRIAIIGAIAVDIIVEQLPPILEWLLVPPEVPDVPSPGSGLVPGGNPVHFGPIIPNRLLVTMRDRGWDRDTVHSSQSLTPRSFYINFFPPTRLWYGSATFTFAGRGSDNGTALISVRDFDGLRCNVQLQRYNDRLGSFGTSWPGTQITLRGGLTRYMGDTVPAHLTYNVPSSVYYSVQRPAPIDFFFTGA